MDDVEEGEHHVPAALYDVNDVEFGSLANRSHPALSRHRNFLRGKPSYLLYFWELMDRHQLLQTTMQRLDQWVMPTLFAVYKLQVPSRLDSQMTTLLLWRVCLLPFSV